MRRVDDDHVSVASEEFLRSLEVISLGSHRRTDSQSALAVLRSVRVDPLLLNVLDCDEALQFVLIVDNQELLDSILVEELFRLFERGAHGHGDEILFCHHGADGHVVTALESQVAICQDSDKHVSLGNRDAGNPVVRHQFQGVSDLGVGADGDRVDDHPGLATLDAINFFGLPFDRHVSMHDRETPMPSKRDREPGLGDRVHGGAKDGDIDGHVARYLRGRVHVGRQHFAVGGEQKYVVEGK